MILEVYDLFNRFDRYFDEIVFYDKDENIEDAVCFDWKNDRAMSEKNWNDFLDVYGYYDVVDFTFNYSDNRIFIEIRI